jgi:hypothetical protein
VSVLAWASTAATWSTEPEAWSVTPDESCPEAIAAVKEKQPRAGEGEVEESLTVGQVAVFALGPKLIEEGDPAIAMGVVRPQAAQAA